MSKRKDKGFTIVETVIAIAIVSVITLVATSVVLAGRQTAKSSADKILAVNLCDNAIVTFCSASLQSASDQQLYSTFKQRLYQTLGYSAQDCDNLEAKIMLDSSWNQVETQRDCKYFCSFYISSSGETAKLEVAVYQGDKELYTATYTASLGRYDEER